MKKIIFTAQVDKEFWEPNIAFVNTLPVKIEEIIKMRIDGKSLADIGKHFGCQRERVRLILHKYRNQLLNSKR